MSVGAEFTTWLTRCIDGGGFGISHGDTFHRGYRNYSHPYPCPNGFEHRHVEFDEIREIPVYKRMIEKARRDAEEWGAVIRLRELAALITVDEIQNDLQEIREWAQSLKRPALSESGSIKSTRHEVR